MHIRRVLFPVVTDRLDETVAFYRDVLGLPIVRSFEHAGFALTWLDSVVVLTATDPAALVVPRQVSAIFIVDDLEAFWRVLEPRTTVLQQPWDVPTGRAFVTRHPDGRAIEYLQLAGDDAASGAAAGAA